jgi:hypothetical protein
MCHHFNQTQEDKAKETLDWDWIDRVHRGTAIQQRLNEEA